MALGERPMSWRKVAEYLRCLKALLAGETAEWEGAKICMLHPPGFGAQRPIDVPILIGADSPKGLAVAAELGDGVFSAAIPRLPLPRHVRAGGAAAVDALPGGQSWREAIEAYPEGERHLAIHAGHLVKANPRDEPHIAELIPFVSSMALTGTAEQIPEKIAGLAALGVTEIVYQPAGSDIERELRVFASAAGVEV